jgi:vacuolar-type H+-ATPase subunit H
MKTIVNCETGEVIERELNKAEKDQQKIDEANVAARKKIAEAEAKAQATAREELLNKLGITADEAKLLLG